MQADISVEGRLRVLKSAEHLEARLFSSDICSSHGHVFNVI